MKRPDCRRCHNDHKRVRKQFRASPAFSAMLKRQDGRCACCGTAKLKGGRETHVDHDHATGRVLGLLCEPCNLGGGKLGDNPRSGFQWFLYQCRVKGLDPWSYIAEIEVAA
jgi:hypothetical protein